MTVASRFALSCLILLPLTLPGCTGSTNWVEYESDAGKFSARFPREPKTKKVDTVTTVLAMAPEISGSYTVSFWELNEIEAEMDPRKILEERVERRKSYAEIKKSESLTVNGHPAIRFELVDQKTSDTAQSGMSIIAHDKIYNVGVMGKAGSLDHETVEKFFDSFELAKAGPSVRKRPRRAIRPSNSGAGLADLRIAGRRLQGRIPRTSEGKVSRSLRKNHSMG